jgi:hypothetical protein
MVGFHLLDPKDYHDPVHKVSSQQFVFIVHTNPSLLQLSQFNTLHFSLASLQHLLQHLRLVNFSVP